MIRLPQKIVLCGVSGSGKSTLGDNFTRRFGHIQTAFADPLKEATRTIFGFEAEHLWGPSELRETRYRDFETVGWCFDCNVQMLGPERHSRLMELYDHPEKALEMREHANNADDYWKCWSCHITMPRYVTPRTALQTLGTAWGRRYCADLWAKSCFARMNPTTSYVVTDCRFTNEREAARAHRACIVLLTRALDRSTSTHPSEAEIRIFAKAFSPDEVDVVLHNEAGSAEDNFAQLVKQLIELGRLAPAHIEWKDYPADER